MKFVHGLRSVEYDITRLNVYKVGATTYYVDGTDGDDDNDGKTWDTAKKTIQAAIDIADTWSVVYIKSGTYNENIDIPQTLQNLTVIGEFDATGEFTNGTIIDATDSSSHAIVVNSRSVTIRNIIFKHNSIDYSCIKISDWFSTIDKCYFRNDSGVGVLVDVDSYYCDIKNSYFFRIGTGVKIKSHYSKIRECYFEKGFAGSGEYGIEFDALQLTNYGLMCDNDITNFSVGIKLTGSYNVVYHNNFLTNTTDIDDTGADSTCVISENYYDNHTNINNGNYISTSPHGNDLSPVIFYNAWKLTSLHRSVLRKNTYSYDTASAVTFNGTSWVDLKEVTVTADTQLTAIKMTTSGTFAGTPKYRILRDGVKVFPYNTENDIESGVLREFDYPINIPINSTYKVQIRSTDAADTTQTVALNELDKIEVI